MEKALLKRPEKILLVLLIALVAISGILIGGRYARDRHETSLEHRRHEVSAEELESRIPLKPNTSIEMDGTEDKNDFQIVMLGFTNYFMKEKWGAERGERFMFGGYKPGGYKVTVRTANFSGEWQNGWHASAGGIGGGGGGGGLAEYSNDFLPCRQLCNKRGFIGIKYDHEYHVMVTGLHQEYAPTPIIYSDEECEKPIAMDQITFPQRIVWNVSTKYPGSWDRQFQKKQRIFLIKSFKFRDDVSEKWFDARIEEYFPDSLRKEITNASPHLISTNK